MRSARVFLGAVGLALLFWAFCWASVALAASQKTGASTKKTASGVSKGSPKRAAVSAKGTPKKAKGVPRTGSRQATAKGGSKSKVSKSRRTSAPRKVTASARKRSTRSTTARYQRNTQQHPTPDRYREIQRALADKGYPTPVDGVWGPESVEALKRFQADRNLPADGKLTALTIIGLGLGPQRAAALPGESREQP